MRAVMPMVVDKLLAELLKISRRKEKLMAEILAVSGGLADINDSWEDLEKLLAARQKYITEIDKLDVQINNIKQKILSLTGAAGWEDVQVIYPEAVKQLRECWRHSSEMAGKAKKLTDKGREQVEEKLKELQKGMKKLQLSKAGMAAYHNKPAQQSGYFIDKKK
ncbi:MAG: hypothetical protein H0Z40_11755 [Desulfotomaculum sp.]|nr:hypothetical protein [Desulfotomaculum sp.]MBO8138773.1 hypothetical protein [Desulfotomaculum sp.]